MRSAAPTRTDWRRNHDRIVSAATAVVARDGAGASLEEIARRAAVGSATLHRHFPSRRDLLDAVFHDGIVRLCGRADELIAADVPPGDALRDWLTDLSTYTAETRGVTTALLAGPAGGVADRDSCRGLIGDAGEELVRRAAAAGAVRPDTSAHELIMLTNAVAVAAEDDPAAIARLLGLAFDGVFVAPRSRKVRRSPASRSATAARRG